MKGVGESGKVTTWTQLQVITQIIPDASQGSYGTDGGFHLPRSGSDFLLAASHWGSQSACVSETQFTADQDSERRILVPLEQKLS